MMKQVIALVVSLGGCVEVADELGDHAQTSTLANGASLNGASLNGASLNGASLNGASLNGASLNGASLNGASLDGGQLVGVDATGQALTGTMWIGVTVTGTTSSGASVELRIDDAVTLPAPNTDVWGYRVTYADGQVRSPICGNADNLAVVIAGRWDYRQGIAGAGGWIDDPGQFTFACRGASIAKCIELGYQPWRTIGVTLLRDHHVACVRMLRADYCGDGRSWTRDGTPINVYDALGIQQDAEQWAIDAQWTVAGGRCVNHTRILDDQPQCVESLASGGCVQVFRPGTLLVNEFAPLTPSGSSEPTKTAKTRL